MSVAAFADDEEALRKYESQIINFFQNNTPILSHQKEITLEEVLKYRELTRKALDRLNVQYRYVSGAEARKLNKKQNINSQTYLSYLLESKAAVAKGDWDIDEARGYFEVISVQPNPGSKTFLRSEGVIEEFTQLRKAGYDIKVDPYTRLTGTVGHYDKDMKSILLAADARVEDYVHEASHAKFDAFKIPDFIDAVKAETSEARREVLMKSEPYKKFGEQQLRQVIKLVDRGYPANSINEALALTEEIRLNEEKDFTFHTDYIGKHLIKDVRRLGIDRPLTAKERQAFVLSLLTRMVYRPEPEATKRQQFRDLLLKYIIEMEKHHPDEFNWVMDQLESWNEQGSEALLGYATKKFQKPSHNEDFVKLNRKINEALINSRSRRHVSDAARCREARYAIAG